MRNTNLNAVNNSNVAHNWAHATGNVKKGSNFYYDDNGIIYSFGSHFPIARRLSHKLFYYTLQTWSGSYTSRHKSLTSRAIPTDAVTVYMRYVPTGVSSDIDHESNLMYWLGQLTTAKREFLNARSKTKHILNINSIIGLIDNYKFHFNIDPCTYVPALLEFYTWYTGIDIQSILEIEGAKDKERTAKREAKETRLHTEGVTMWRNFEVKEIPYNLRSEYTLLRYNVKTCQVETSKGIKVPVDIANRLYTTIKGKIANGGCIGCNVLVFGSYAVNEITDSYIVAGCHKIQITEIDAVYNTMQSHK